MDETHRCPTCLTPRGCTTDFRLLQLGNFMLFCYSLGAATQPLLHHLYLAVR